VAVYGAVLGLSAATALGTNPTIAVGAGLFLLSDSVLACKLFLPGFGFWQQDLVIMALYCAGQGLIALGLVRATRARLAARASIGAPE
jgi:alkenylglycerophosphocholine/alkenylglycerophosphoethanolamine hydrolase